MTVRCFFKGFVRLYDNNITNQQVTAFWSKQLKSPYHSTLQEYYLRTMSYNDTVPVIPFHVNYDESNIEFIKHERVTLDNNGNEDKVNERVPRLSE